MGFSAYHKDDDDNDAATEDATDIVNGWFRRVLVCVMVFIGVVEVRPKPYEPGSSSSSRVVVSVINESKITNDDDVDRDWNRGRHGGIASVILLFVFSFCPSIKKMKVYYI